MDVEDLAPALLGVGALCKRANEQFNGPSVAISVQVRSNFQTGSFDIDFDLIQATATAVLGAVPLFTPENIKSARDLAALIGLVTVGDEKAFTSLFGLIKWLRGERIKKIEPVTQNEFKIINEHGDNLTINGDVHQLILNPAIREAAHQTLRPLEQPTVTAVEFIEGGTVVDDVTKMALPFFHLEDAVPEPPSDLEEVLSDNTRPMAYEVIRPSFDPTLQWTMSDGDRHIGVYVDDKEFMDRVARGVYEFRAGAVVVGDYRIRSVRVDGRIKTDYRLVHAAEVKLRPVQHPLLPPAANI